MGARLREAEIKRQAGPRHQAYWKATIFQLYPKDDGDLKPDDPAFDFIDRFVKDTEAGLIQAKAASKQHIDTDVVKLADQYIELSEEFLKTLRPLREEFGKRLRGMTVRELMSGVAAFDGQITDDQIAQIPGFERKLLETFFFQSEAEQQVLHNIEIMQARLSERYKGIEFPLPASMTAPGGEQ